MFVRVSRGYDRVVREKRDGKTGTDSRRRWKRREKTDRDGEKERKYRGTDSGRANGRGRKKTGVRLGQCSEHATKVDVVVVCRTTARPVRGKEKKDTLGANIHFCVNKKGYEKPEYLPVMISREFHGNFNVFRSLFRTFRSKKEKILNQNRVCRNYTRRY